ncbi:MAG: hypothetical protein K0U52_03695 [Gammaproteobacteria bacterium]|nr:hypothetical protein [Gammaproteobacteria bacterium]
MSSFPNFYGPRPPAIDNLIGHRRRTPGYHLDLKWPGTVFTGAPVPCGPIQDPYCPSGMGVVGGFDMFGFPTCVCPVNKRASTWPIIPVGSPAAAVQWYPIGPFAYPQLG